MSSLHYVETVTGQIEGESLDSREEGWYQAPDAAHIVGDAEHSPLGLENIVIGTQGLGTPEFWLDGKHY